MPWHLVMRRLVDAVDAYVGGGVVIAGTHVDRLVVTTQCVWSNRLPQLSDFCRRAVTRVVGEQTASKAIGVVHYLPRWFPIAAC